MNLIEALNKECPVPYKRTRDMSESEYMKLVDRNTKLVDKMKEQQARIDKAIEYIEGQNRFIKGCDINLITDWNYVLEILKGSDKE